MSYGRNPHYIWSDGECLHLGLLEVPEELINAFLYKVMLTNRRDELAERLRIGREEWTKLVKTIDSDEEGNSITWQVVDVPHDDPEYVETAKWMKSQEDDVLRRLMEE